MITVEDRFEQYLLAEAWRNGLRKPDEVADFVDFWRTTAPAQRVLVGMRVNAAFKEMALSIEAAGARATAAMSRATKSLKNRR